MADEITIMQPGTDELHDVSTDEVFEMVLGTDDDDVVFGRMPMGLDPSEFDYLPPREVDADEDQAQYLHAPDDATHPWQGVAPTGAAITQTLDAGGTTLMGDDEMAEPFASPSQEAFPLFKRALKHFRAAETPARLMRVDTDGTYNEFASAAAVRELGRRLNELRTFAEEHVADKHGAPVAPMSEWTDIIGCAQVVHKIRGASTADEATDAMPQVPLDLPDFAKGKVKCWRDGDAVVVSMRFCDANGEPRIATMAAKPRIDADDVLGWAQRSGTDAITVLGVVTDLVHVACGNKLVRDIAGAALKAQRRVDVVGMDDDEPILLVDAGNEGQAPIAALMYVKQLADAGHEQAQDEMALIETAAATPTGQEVMAPVLEEAHARLAEGRQKKRSGQSLLAGCCG